MISLTPPVHTLSRCVCGHDEHLRRESHYATNDPDQRRQGGVKQVTVVCEACEQIEAETEMQMAFVQSLRAERLGIAKGQAVTVGKVSFRVAEAVPIMKLDGRVDTGWSRVMLRRVA